MDLRNHTITVGELLDNPRSRAVFQRRFGKLMNHPMVGAARSLTLRQLAEEKLDMFCTAFVGNGQTQALRGKMVTPRGYEARL